jgi:hypothetical protein
VPDVSYPRYRHELIRIRYDLPLYPVDMLVLGGKFQYLVKSEADFVEILGRALRSEEMREVINTLRAHAADR